MRCADVRIVQVDHRLLDHAAQEPLGLAHEVLVECVLAGDEHGPAVSPPPRAAPPLPEAGDRTGEAGHEGDVEFADVDAELEGAGRDHGVELVLEEPALDVAALLRRVAGAVGLNAVGGPGVALVEAAADGAEDELRRLAGRREGDHARAGQHGLAGHVGRFCERAAAGALVGVFERRVPEDDGALVARGAVVFHSRERQADQPLGESLGLGDRRRGEHEPRRGAVGGAEPPQAPHDLGDVRAEHAAIDVRFVDDDVAQVMEELGPALVRRQDADVQHVRVGEEEVGRAADRGALIGRRVAVIDGGRHAGRAQRAEFAYLVLRERLRRVEVEGSGLRVGGDRLQGRQREGERLAARRARGEHDVRAVLQKVPRGALVPVQACDSGPFERAADVGSQVLRQVGVAGVPRRLVGDGDDLPVAIGVEEAAQGVAR